MIRAPYDARPFRPATPVWALLAYYLVVVLLVVGLVALHFTRSPPVVATPVERASAASASPTPDMSSPQGGDSSDRDLAGASIGAYER
ncbi:hypothetical protein [Piscinibacter sp. XHJ-5]|uniref:hypothetical protein n=1 Tax=Piscinibacter sp. XHJ-5 TaxID=3037797 RepID=UPI002453327F|nr:hypothetical protein [Piscinibacter sp. XHJ-5]